MKFLSLQVLVLSCYTALWTQATTEPIHNGAIGKLPFAFNKTSRFAHGFSGLYLNTEYSSTQNGRVIAWEYCYFINAFVENPERVVIKAGVWRRNNTKYQLVDNSSMSLPTPILDSSSQFICREWTLNSFQMFEVQDGDIVGIYVNDTSSVSAVHILGMTGQDATTEHVGAENVTDITSSVTDDQLNTTPYSLYLMAVIGEQPPGPRISVYVPATEPMTPEEVTPDPFTILPTTTTNEQTFDLMPTTWEQTFDPMTTTWERTFDPMTTTWEQTFDLLPSTWEQMFDPVPTTFEQTRSLAPTMTSISTTRGQTTSAQMMNPILTTRQQTNYLVTTASNVIKSTYYSIAAIQPTNRATATSEPTDSTTTDEVTSLSTNDVTMSSEPTAKTVIIEELKSEHIWHAITAILSAVVLALLVTITVIICKLCATRRSIKSSGPILITHGRGTLSGIVRVFRHTTKRDVAENDDEHRANSQRETPTSPQSIAPVFKATNPTHPNHSEATSPSSNPRSSQSTAFAATSGDNQLGDDSDRVLVEPKHLWPPPNGVSTNKTRVRRTRDKMRSKSAFDVSSRTLARAGDDESAQFTFSSDYPYVLHTHEVMGRQHAHVIGSLPPNIEHHSPLRAEFGVERPQSNLMSKQDQQSYVAITSHMDTVDEFEPSYSYTDKRHATEFRKYGKEASQNDSNEDEGSEGFYFTGNPLMVPVVVHTPDTAPTDSQSTPKVMPHPLSNTHTTEGHHIKPPPSLNRMSVNGSISSCGSTDNKSSNRYMKLLKRADDCVFDYESLLKSTDSKELVDLTMSGIDLEHPTEWCKVTQT